MLGLLFFLVVIELIMVFRIDGFITTFSWLHVTFAAITDDTLFPPHCCFLYLTIAFSEKTESFIQPKLAEGNKDISVQEAAPVPSCCRAGCTSGQP